MSVTDDMTILVQSSINWSMVQLIPDEKGLLFLGQKLFLLAQIATVFYYPGPVTPSNADGATSNQVQVLNFIEK